MVAAACGGGTPTSSENLASDQTLSFPMVDDVGNLDPATMSAAVDIDIFRNSFSGLYKFDNNLNEVADIATSDKPDISSDGLTYMFKMKQNVKFSNETRSRRTTSSSAGTAPPPCRAITRASLLRSPATTTWPPARPPRCLA